MDRPERERLSFHAVKVPIIDLLTTLKPYLTQITSKLLKTAMKQTIRVVILSASVVETRDEAIPNEKRPTARKIQENRTRPYA